MQWLLVQFEKEIVVGTPSVFFVGDLKRGPEAKSGREQCFFFLKKNGELRSVLLHFVDSGI